MTEKNLDARIGAAWGTHYKGQDDAAVQQFTDILQDNPASIDANWGLGLAYRSLNQNDQARAVFLKAKQLIEDEQANEDAATPGRYFMLNRMVDQQLTYLEQFIT
ncbi:MAG: hypothetical protein IT325_11950 [Anaerolineae bacterium]|nr:hypothetical protein [Anaerolineae bacterium]